MAKKRKNLIYFKLADRSSTTQCCCHVGVLERLLCIYTPEDYPASSLAFPAATYFHFRDSSTTIGGVLGRTLTSSLEESDEKKEKEETPTIWQKSPAESLPPIPKCGCSKLPPFQPGSKIKLTKEKEEYQKKEKKRI